MTTDKRLSRLSRRFDTPTPGVPTGASKAQASSPARRRGQKPDRARQSIHFANQAFTELDNAYSKAEHDAYPRKFSKANFVEALIEYGIQHVDEVVAIALQRQAAEDDEE